MRAHSSTRFAAMAVLVGALACASNTAREADTDAAAAARDTTTSDTLGGQEQNPAGYRGMERDTAIAPTGQPSDTFIQNQGTGQPQDTAGYSGMERADTTGAAAGAGDTTAWAVDSAATNQTGVDSTATPSAGDTTGYDDSQVPNDTTISR